MAALCVRHQHSLDRIGEIRKGGFLAHRSHTGSADETEIRDAAQVVRTGCEGHPPSDAEAIFGWREDPYRAGWPAWRIQHCGTMPARRDRREPVLQLVEGVPGGGQAPACR